MEINFFNKIDSQGSVGLNRFHYNGNKKPVQIFGTVKIFKNEKNSQGAKIIEVNYSYVLYLRADVMHAWIYLTGKVQELKDNKNQINIEHVKKLDNDRNRYDSERNSEMDEAINLLDNYLKKENKNDISQNDIMNLLVKFGVKRIIL